MANPFYVEPANILQALMIGKQSYDDASKSSGRRSAQSALEGGDARGAIAALIGAGDPQGANALAQYQNNANSVYGTPIYGTDGKGQSRIGSFDRTGTFRPIDTGDFTPTPGIRTVDMGTGTGIINSRTGAPMGPSAGPPGSPLQQGQAPGFIPKDIQGEAQQKASGADIGEKQANMGKAQSTLRLTTGAIDRMIQSAERVEKGSVAGITGWSGVFPSFPGGAAANTQANLNTLKGQISFGALQAMREASKTGGALGNVSDQEGKRLEGYITALEQAQDEKQFRKAMKDIIAYGHEVKDILKGAYDQDYASLPARGQQMTPAQPAQKQGVRKTIGGKNYYQSNGQWFEE